MSIDRRHAHAFFFLTCCFVLAGCGGGGGGSTPGTPTAAGEPDTLVQIKDAPYFSSRDSAVYLTGSHTWSNFQDGDDTPFDFDAYLNLLTRNHHNLIRLWISESPQADGWLNPAPGWDGTGPWYRRASPMPFARTGPGLATDGQPKFDLTRFNDAYFERLRVRVQAARARGIYVSIMLFNFWTASNESGTFGVRNVWRYHPFNATNNVNDVNGDADGDNNGIETHTLQVPAVTRAQEAYVARVIQAVNEFDNVLYEISNEDLRGDPEWQLHMIRFIKRYEAGLPRQHPVGLTGAPSIDPELLRTHPGDWSSPSAVAYESNNDPLNSNPPEVSGSKVSLLDSDHTGYAIFRDDANFATQWVWKSFLRGHHPLLMEDLTDSPGWVAARAAMGHTRRYTERLSLEAVSPQSALSSTTYCLANPGHAYVVYQPDAGPFSVTLAAGRYAAEWFDPVAGSVLGTDSVLATGGRHTFAPPHGRSAVLYLTRVP